MDPPGPDPHDKRPPPTDLSHHLSRSTKARQPSSMKQSYKYFFIPGIGQIASGLPNHSYFPFDTLEAKVALPERWEPTPNHPIDPPTEGQLERLTLGGNAVLKSSGNAGVKSSGNAGVKSSALSQPQANIVVPHTSQQSNPIKKIDLASALQYGTAEGYPPLYYFLRQFTRENLHPNCPYQGGPEVILTCGSTDGFSKTLIALTNEWSAEKDWVRDREGLLVEEFCYMNAVQAAQPRGLNIVPVGIDDEGMRADGPGGLKEVLENWDQKRGKRPHLMYTVTMGQNPTSGVLSLQRRRDLYALCSKYDIIIVEDDPYWYLQYPSATAMNTVTTSDPSNTSYNPEISMLANGEPRPEGWKSTGFPFLDSLVPSSISIDTDGRVIRLDTFSKTFAPGCRLGWISAQPALVERILRITETSTQQPSGFVQSIVAELLLGPDHSGITDLKPSRDGGKGPLKDGKGWKVDRFVRWIEGLRGNYERRMTTMSSILDSGKYLVKSGRRSSLASTAADNDEWAVVEKTQMYSFDWPVGGMFLWLHMHFASHPLYHRVAHARLSRALWFHWISLPYRVLTGPGTMFSVTDDIRDAEGWKYFRLCFAAVDDEMLAPLSSRLVEGVDSFWRIKSVGKIDELLKDDEDAVEGRVGGAVDLSSMMGPC